MKSTTIIILFIIITNTLTSQVHWWSSNGDALENVVLNWRADSSDFQLSWGYETDINNYPMYEKGSFDVIAHFTLNFSYYRYEFPENLLPGVNLYYKIENLLSGEVFENSYQTAEDDNGDSFTFFVGGDNRDDILFGDFMIGKWDDLTPLMPVSSFTLGTGDIVDDGDNIEQWEKMFAEGQSFLSNNILFQTIGNHDNRGSVGYGDEHSFYGRFYDFPNNNRYYSFTHQNALFICLNSEGWDNDDNHWGADQDAWLEQTLQQHADKTWKIVWFHRPFFTYGSHSGEMDYKFSTWWKLFQNYGVDIVFNGHTHNYLRTVPIHIPNPQNYLDPNENDSAQASDYTGNCGTGIMQVVAGGMGAPLDPTNNFRWFKAAHSGTKYHYVSVTIEGNKLDMYAIEIESGDVFDEVHFNKASNIILTTDATQVCEGEAVNIQVQGVDSITWNILDSVEIVSQNSINVFPVENTTYVITGVNGNCTNTDSVSIIVKKQPQASFTVNTDNTPLIIVNNQSAYGSSYLWDFGDGYTINSFNASHSYSTPGNYTISLIVTNDCGVDTVFEEITINTTGFDNIFTERNIKIYPSPIINSINIELPTNEDIDILLLNKEGKLVKNFSTEGTTFFEINVVGLPAGMYSLVFVATNGKNAIKQFLKQ